MLIICLWLYIYKLEIGVFGVGINLNVLKIVNIYLLSVDRFIVEDKRNKK